LRPGVSAHPSRGARRRRPGSAATRPVWLFDLDNTLHHASHAIFPLINQAMTAYIEGRLGLERAEANRLRTLYTRRYGATLAGLLRHHDVDPHDFLRTVHTFPALAPLLRAERGLARLLRALPGRKLVLTNGPQDYAHAVLAELGIDTLFEQVIAIEHMRHGKHWHAKPDAAMLRRAMRRAGVRLADAILVEDTRGHLKRYKRLGLRTVWMVGHLPAIQSAEHLKKRRAGSGRPHYVDYRIHSLKSLQIGPGLRPCSRYRPKSLH
jgi:pyrimidine 5'-nucleotidase